MIHAGDILPAGRRSGRDVLLLHAGLVSVALLGCQQQGAVIEAIDRRATVAAKAWPGPATTQDARVPLTVDRAVAEALAASPQIEQVRQRIAAAAAQVRQAEAAFYPRLAVSQDFSATNNPVYALMYVINQKRFSQNINFNNPGQEQNAASVIHGEWTVFEGGARWYNRRAAQQEQRSTEADLLAARNDLVAAVTETYYRWLQAMDFVGVAARAVEVAKANEKLAENRLEVEMVLRSEVARLKTNRAEAEGELVTARGNARKLQAAMERLLARRIGPEEIPHPTALPLPPEAPEGQPEALVAEALRRRAEMAAAEALVAAARARVRAAAGALLPAVAAHAEYEWNSRDLTDAQGSWMAGVQATWNIFEGGTRWARIAEAKARLREMDSRGQQIALDIALEVSQAAAGLQDAIARIAVATDQKTWAEQGLKETRELYRNQVVTVDALLQAELAWNRAEAAYSAAAFEGQIAYTVLRKALGDFADRIGAGQ